MLPWFRKRCWPAKQALASNMQERTRQGRGSAFLRGPRKSFPLRVLLARPVLSCAHYFKRLLCRLKRCGLLKFGKSNSKGWNGAWLIQPCSLGLLVFKLGAIARKMAMATRTSESNRFRLAKQQVFMCITLFVHFFAITVRPGCENT